MKVCDCNMTLSNQGTGCVPLTSVIVKLIPVPTFDSTGVRNGIDLTTATLNEAFFTALINQSDASKRWYPLPSMKNVTSPRADAVVETFDDGTSQFVTEGAKTFDGIVVGRDANPMVKAQMDSIRCGEISVYGVDKNGSLYGSISSDGTMFYPTRIDSQSFQAILQGATGTTVQKLNVKFNYHPDENDGDLRMITADELGGSYLLTTKGLIEVTMVFSSLSTTGVVVKMKTPFGTQLNPVLKKGLLVANFISSVGAATSKARNVTDGSDISITSVTEDSTGGTYTLAWTAQTSADVVAILATATGYHFTATTFVTP